MLSKKSATLLIWGGDKTCGVMAQKLKILLTIKNPKVKNCHRFLNVDHFSEMLSRDSTLQLTTI
jgi:hypothetical protein